MFSEKVSTLTLDKARINLLDSDGMAMDPARILVEDICCDCSTLGESYLPDQVVAGYFLETPYKPTFKIVPEGPHLLYITGIPKEVVLLEKAKFRFDDRLWISYWEDNSIGYLFQVVTKRMILDGLLNNNKR